MLGVGDSLQGKGNIQVTDIDADPGDGWITPLYNRAGNMTRVPKPSDPAQYYTCTYDAWNRLVKVEEGTDTVAEYEYDGAKRRTVKKTCSAGQLDETRHFFYTEPSRWQVIEERLEAGCSLSSDPDRQFIWGIRYVDDLILRDRHTTGGGTLDERLYALQDANWNVTSIGDATGTIQERYAYTAYGTPHILTRSFTSRATSNHAWETLFAGYRWENEVRFYQVRHRIFHAALGWVQRDLIGPAPVVNLYEYVGGNPVNRCDPSGFGSPLTSGWEAVKCIVALWAGIGAGAAFVIAITACALACAGSMTILLAFGCAACIIAASGFAGWAGLNIANAVEECLTCEDKLTTPMDRLIDLVRRIIERYV